MNKHKTCQRMYWKNMRVLKKSYVKGVRIEIEVQPQKGLNRYHVRNIQLGHIPMTGLIWVGVACCKWRARLKAVKVLRERVRSLPCL